jgi:hypothetical protein
MNPYLDIFFRGVAFAGALIVNGAALVVVAFIGMVFIGWTRRESNPGNQG